MATISTPQHAALNEFLGTWNEPYLLDDLGPKLNCREADHLAEFLAEFDEPDAAEVLLASHALADDEGDRHYVCPTCTRRGDHADICADPSRHDASRDDDSAA